MQQLSINRLLWQPNCVSVWLSAEASLQNCESSRPSCHSISSTGCLPRDPFLSSTTAPPCLFTLLSLSTCRHLKITFSFKHSSLFFTLKDECRHDRVIQGCSNLEGRLLFSLSLFFFLPFSQTMLLPTITISCTVFRMKFCFGLSNRGLSRFKAIAAFQFPLCAFHLAAGRHGAGCASFPHNGLHSHNESRARC